MNLLQKIYNSRKVLKQLLSNEWIVDDINELSLEELKIMYENSNDKAYLNSPCNITLQNKYIPSHKLHIIYYNFPELNTSHVKITKNCATKIEALYTNEIINHEDSVIVIVMEKISENLNKSVEEVYLNGQEKLLNDGLSEQIIQENEHN